MSDTVIWESKPSQIFNTRIFIYLGILICIYFIIPNQILNFTISKTIQVFHLLLFIIIFYLFYMLWNCLSIFSIRYVLTNERILIYSGILSQQRDEIELYRLNDYKVVASFFMRIFGLGNIILYTSDRSTSQVTLFGVKNAFEVTDTIRANVEKIKIEKKILFVNT